MTWTDVFVKGRSKGDGAGQALALVPIVVAGLFTLLMLPHAVPPDEIPLPTVDERAVTQAMADDQARIDHARRAPLSAEVRAVGSAVRAFNRAEALHAEEVDMSHARDDVNAARRVAISTGKFGELKDLRAVQMDQFLTEVRRFESTGEVSRELEELGGTFVQRMAVIGWCVGHRVLMGDAVRRVAFKVTWNKLLFFDAEPQLALTLDEIRLLYAFYFTHAHPSEAQRPLLDALRAGVSDPLSAKHATETERVAVAAWLQPKVTELARVDPTYPAPLARAALSYLRQDYTSAAGLYEAWLNAHPSGPWTLRVQNYLRAAVLGEEDRLR